MIDMKQMLAEGERTTAINQKIKASGKRYMLPLEGRQIEVIHYEAGADKPVIFGMHGGGFLFGGCAFDDAMWVSMRDELQMNIISIGYSKTPEHAWPKALYDVLDSIMHILWMPEIAFDRSQMYIFGNSAGGNLAAAAAIALKDSGVPIKGQILNYPWLDIRPDTEDEMNNFYSIYYIGEADPTNKLLSPIHASLEDLGGLPPAILTVCGIDHLRAEGLKYADMLKEAGVKVVLHEAENMHHAYFEASYGRDADEEMIQAAKETLSFIKEEIKRL